MTLHLDAAGVEAIARRVVELLRGECLADELLDASEVARRFHVSRDFVYRHAEELGAVRVGDGPKAPLRFNPATVEERLAPALPAEPNGPEPAPRPRRKTPARPGTVELLP